MKSFGIGVGSTPSSGSLRQGGSQPGSNLPASLANSKKRVVSSQSMLESRYSKTFIYTPQAKEVKVKEVRCQQFSRHTIQRFRREGGVFYCALLLTSLKSLKSQEAELIELPETSCNLTLESANLTRFFLLIFLPNSFMFFLPTSPDHVRRIN